MANPNKDLPENLLNLIEHLGIGASIPMGLVDDKPFFAIKLSESDIAALESAEIVSQLKPTLLNIDFEDHTYAILVLQIILNNSTSHIYNTFFDLSLDTHFKDVLEVLKLQEYGLFMFTQERHDFVAYNTETKIDFDLPAVAMATKVRATEYKNDVCHAIVDSLLKSQPNNSELLQFFNNIAPLETQWYAHLKMDK
jgi:hypothetical protein